MVPFDDVISHETECIEPVAEAGMLIRTCISVITGTPFIPIMLVMPELSGYLGPMGIVIWGPLPEPTAYI